MKKLVFVVVLAAVAVGAFAYVVTTTPPWYERIRYPLRYSEYVRVHAREHKLDPALMAAVIYQESKFRDQTSRAGAERRSSPHPSDTRAGPAARAWATVR